MNDNIYEHVDQHRWLLNNGLFTDQAKDTLYLYGAIVNKSVTAVELSVNSNTKNIKYTLFFSPSFLKDYNKYLMLKNTTSLLGMWRLKRLLKRNGNLELLKILSSFVKTYCGPTWSVDLDIKESSEYEEELKTDDDKVEDRDAIS